MAQHEGQHGYDCAPCAEILTIRPEILNQPCGCPPVDSDILCPLHAAAPALLSALEKIRDNRGRGCDSPNWMQANVIPGFNEKWECGDCAPCQAHAAILAAKGD